MASKIKLITDTETGESRWVFEETGATFIQCAYSPRDRFYNFCGPSPDIPEIGDECGTGSTSSVEFGGSSGHGSGEFSVVMSDGSSVLSSSFSSSFSSVPSSGGSSVSSAGSSSVAPSSASSVAPSSASSSDYAPNLTFSLIGRDWGGNAAIKWRGVVRNANKIVAIPYAWNFPIVIDTVDDSVTQGPSTEGIETSDLKWVGGIFASNGIIYGNPNYAKGYLAVDTSTDPITLRDTENYGSFAQTRGGAEVNGIIYSPNYSSGIDNVKRLDISSESILPSIPFTPDRTGPIYTARPNWEGEATYYARYYGAVYSPLSDKVYGIPYTADRILIIDSVLNTAYQGADLLSGNAPIPTTLDISNGVFWNKYAGGTLSYVNNCIYAFPRHGRAILKIDPSDDSAVEIPLPAALLYDDSVEKTFSSFDGPDGYIYSVPWNMPYLFWINPADDSIGYMDISSFFDSIPSTSAHYTYGTRNGNDVYFSPGRAKKVLKLTFN